MIELRPDPTRSWDAAADLALRRRVLKGMAGRALRDVVIERLLRARPPLGADE
jgi:hypothetical protein